jgi:hypothetical protein
MVRWHERSNSVEGMVDDSMRRAPQEGPKGRVRGENLVRLRVLGLGVSLLSFSALGACGQDPTRPELELGEAELRVLFVGNSLTYTNDLPAMVQTIAEAAGHTLARAVVAAPNYSLEEHWNGGGGDVVTALGADVVVLQQGPSSLPANQEHLRSWTEVFAPAIRAAGGRPALYMVWPERSRQESFDQVRDAYASAAAAVDGLFIPAGEAWRRVWDADPSIALYGPDGFHPSELGSQVAALTMFRVLFDESLSSLPARMVPVTPGLPVVDLGSEAALVVAAVEEAVVETTAATSGEEGGGRPSVGSLIVRPPVLPGVPDRGMFARHDSVPSRPSMR